MNLKTITYDIKSGIVVFLVALPLCLGIALACQTPLISGVLAGIIGGLIVSVFSGSALSVSGPAAGLTTLIISSLAAFGSYPVFTAAVLCAGILQFMLGIVKAGNISNYIPNAVIKGMLAGIGIILIIKQIPHIFGYDKDPEGDLDFSRNAGENTFSDLLNMVNYITPGALIVAIISLSILAASEQKIYRESRILSLIPAPLLVVITGIIFNLFFQSSSALKISSEHLVTLPAISTLGELGSLFVFPDFAQVWTQKFWTIVFTLSVVASLESLLSIEATDKLDPEKRTSNPNKELIAQGIGNVFCGMLGGLPVTAVIVRSSANISAGAKTKLSAMIHACLLALCVLVIPDILSLIPNASLAAILVTIGFKLIKPSIFTDLYKKGYDQFIPFCATIAIMLVTDLLRGVGAGIIVSVIFIIRANISYSFDSAKDLIDEKMHHIVKLPQHITFFNKGFLIKYFSSIKEGSVVIIDGSINKTIDNDVKDVIRDFLNTTKIKNIKVDTVNLNI